MFNYAEEAMEHYAKARTFNSKVTLITGLFA